LSHVLVKLYINIYIFISKSNELFLHLHPRFQDWSYSLKFTTAFQRLENEHTVPFENTANNNSNTKTRIQFHIQWTRWSRAQIYPNTKTHHKSTLFLMLLSLTVRFLLPSTSSIAIWVIKSTSLYLLCNSLKISFLKILFTFLSLDEH